MSIGPDDRPEVRLALISPDGTVDTIGQHAWGYYETLPAVRDVLVVPDLLSGQPEAHVVVGRQFIQPASFHEPPRWWLILRPAESGQWRDVVQLDDETNKAFAEMAAERSQEFWVKFEAEQEKRRARRTGRNPNA